MRVRQVCDKYDLPYTTGSFLMQYGKAWRTIAKLSLPDRYLRDTADDAPETRSERMFSQLEPGFAGTDLATGRRRGLKTAIAAVREWRRDLRLGEDPVQGGTDHAPRPLLYWPVTYGIVGYASVDSKSGGRSSMVLSQHAGTPSDGDRCT